MRHVAVAHNGAGNALVEQAGVQKQQPVFLLCLHLAAVHVHHIADQLEGVERDADGQHDLRDQLRHAKQALQVFQQEAGVFENPQHQQHQRHAQCKVQLFALWFPLDAYGKEPAQRSIQKQQHHIPRPCPAEKDHGENKHGNILFSYSLQRRLRNQIQRQKQKHKQQAGKYHLVLPKIKAGIKEPPFSAKDIFCRKQELSLVLV